MENTPTPPLNLPDSAPALALRLGLILAGVVGLVARRFLRMPHLMRFTILLCSRLGRAARRFERAMSRPARPARARVRAPQDEAARPRTIGLPQGQAWLVRALGYEAAGYGSQLQALLTDPEMQAVLAGLPVAGRILRPICRMLGVPSELVAPVVVAALPGPIAVVRVRRNPVWPRAVANGLAGAAGECDYVTTGN